MSNEIRYEPIHWKPRGGSGIAFIHFNASLQQIDKQNYLRYQYAPNYHQALTRLYGQTFDKNPDKVYIFKIFSF